VRITPCNGEPNRDGTGRVRRGREGETSERAKRSDRRATRGRDGAWRRSETQEVRCRETERETETGTETEGGRGDDNGRVYSAHSSARSIGECLGKRRTWTTHTVPRDHRASPLAYIRLTTAPRKLYRGPRAARRPIAPRSPPRRAAAAVRYFDTVDTRLISIRYGTPRDELPDAHGEHRERALSHPLHPSLSFCLLLARP